MRVEVDRDVCEANGVCEDVAPEVFRVGEDDVLQILQPEPPAELHDRVREAVLRCPKAALTTTD
jgi:ferredoxin